MQGMWVRSLGQEDTLEEAKATHSNILAWSIPWGEEPEPGRLWSIGSQELDMTERLSTQKEPQIAKTISKRNKVGRLALPDFKIEYKVTVIKVVWSWHKDRCMLLLFSH